MSRFLLIAIAAMTFSQVSLAARRPIQRQFPANLVCAPEAGAQHIQAFEISKLDTKEPDSTFPDASLVDYSDRNAAVSISFSNECDNNYVLSFFAENLLRLARGEVKSVRGLLNYSNSDFEWEANGDQVSEATISVTCRIKN